MWVKSFIHGLHMSSMITFFLVMTQIEVCLLSIFAICTLNKECGVDSMESLFVQLFAALPLVFALGCFLTLDEIFKKIQLDCVTRSFALIGFWGCIGFSIMIQCMYYRSVHNEIVQISLETMWFAFLLLIAVDFVSYIVPPVIFAIYGVWMRIQSDIEKEFLEEEYGDVKEESKDLKIEAV